MTATTRVQVWAFDETLVQTTRFQLAQWYHALKLEIETGMTLSGGKISTHLRKLLKTPARYPASDILDHIKRSKDDIDSQFESGEFDLRSPEGLTAEELGL